MVLPVLFAVLALLGLAGPASICVLLFVAAVLLPIATKHLTVGESYAPLNELRDAFALLKSVDTVVLPKTGTLTAGKHSVVDVQSFAADVTAEQVLELACAVERDSEHPIARAIVAAAANKGLSLIHI